MHIHVKDIAWVAHEANRAYCLSLGDTSQPPWGDAPDWQRVSAVAGVKAHLDNELSPQGSHEVWLKHKENDGWTHGHVKDPVAKTHPCMVPYENLPDEQRLKDVLFSAVVRVFQKCCVHVD